MLRPDVNAPLENAITSPTPGSSPLRILLAEDHAVNQKVALLMLGKLGYRADIAVDGTEVLEAVSARMYDLVLMDVQMPQMDGLEACRWICAQWVPDDRPRIVALTAGFAADRAECLAAGMDDFIAKPIRMSSLRAVLDGCPRRHGPDSQPIALPVPPAVELSVLDTLRELQAPGQPDIVTELIDLFLADAPELVRSMRAAITAGDEHRLNHCAHKLGSSAATLGGAPLATLCMRVEKGTEGATLESYAGEIDGIEAALTRLTAALLTMRRA